MSVRWSLVWFDSVLAASLNLPPHCSIELSVQKLPVSGTCTSSFVVIPPLLLSHLCYHPTSLPQLSAFMSKAMHYVVLSYKTCFGEAVFDLLLEKGAVSEGWLPWIKTLQGNLFCWMEVYKREQKRQISAAGATLTDRQTVKNYPEAECSWYICTAQPTQNHPLVRCQLLHDLFTHNHMPIIFAFWLSPTAKLDRSYVSMQLKAIQVQGQAICAAKWRLPIKVQLIVLRRWCVNLSILC